MTMAIKQYQKIGVHGGVEGANAHRLIQMLMEGALDKVAAAKGCMQRDNVSGKGENIGLAISIVDGLQSSLDKDKGGEIAENLSNLYDYINKQLILANLDDKIEYLDEVQNLLLTIKSGWDGIESEATQILDNGKE